MLRYLITAFMALALLMPAGVHAAFVNYSTTGKGTVAPPGQQNVATGNATLPVTATAGAADPASPKGYHFYNWVWTNPADPNNPFGSTTQNPLSFTVTGTIPSLTARATFLANLSQDILVHGLSNIVDIKAGRSHTVALTNNGTVLVWGATGDNQTGIDKTTGATAIGEGPYYSLAVLNTGLLTASGNWLPNTGATAVTLTEPNTAAPAHGGIKAVAGGMAHSLALMNDGTVFAWGDSSLNKTVMPAFLTTFLTGKQVVAIATGHEHNVALTATGEVVTWGGQSSTVLGYNLPQAICDTSVTGSFTACTFSGLNATAIDAKGFHTLVLTRDGKVFSFGANELGQGNIPANLQVGSVGTTDTDKVTAVAAGAHHSTVLLQNGTVRSWGDNRYGETVIPAGASNSATPITRIAAGSYNNLALQGDSAVLAWGDNEAKQSELPAPFAFNAPTDPQPDFNLLPLGNGVVCVPPGDTSGNINFADYGGSSACAITVGAGYTLTAFIVNGVPVTPLPTPGTPVTLTNVTSQQSITAVFVTKPAAPTAVVATAGDTQATVAFTAPNDGGSAITVYTVTSTPGNITATGAASPITVTGLTNGTAYTFTVTATNGQGTGPASAASNSVTPNLPAAVTLAGLTATYDGTAKVVTATTDPADLTYSVTYDGSATAPIAAGAYTVTATITSTGFTGSATGLLTIAKAQQTLSFGALSARVMSGVPFDLTATASSPLDVSYTSETPTVCTVSGKSVTLVGVGTCTIDVNQAGDTNFEAAAMVKQSFEVGSAVTTTTVSLGGLSATYDGTPKAVVATTTPAGLTTSITYDGSATAPSAAGTYAVVATVTAAGYQGSATGTLTIAKATQTITVDTPAPATAQIGTSFTVAAHAPGGAVTYSASGGCTNTGAIFTMTSATDACTVTYNQAGSASYLAASAVTSATAAKAPVPTGDIDGGGVGVSDAQIALRVAAGLQAVTPEILAAADVAPLVNGVPQPDGKIDIGDVIVLLRKAVGLI